MAIHGSSEVNWPISPLCFPFEMAIMARLSVQSGAAEVIEESLKARGRDNGCVFHRETRPSFRSFLGRGVKPDPKCSEPPPIPCHPGPPEAIRPILLPPFAPSFAGGHHVPCSGPWLESGGGAKRGEDGPQSPVDAFELSPIGGSSVQTETERLIRPCVWKGRAQSVALERVQEEDWMEPPGLFIIRLILMT